MNKILTILILSFIITSCYDESLTQFEGIKSKLKIKVYGKDSTPIQNAIITIIMDKFGISRTELIVDSTNSDGEFIPDLLENIYKLKIEIADRNVFYRAYDTLQIVGGVPRVREYWPCKNSGKIDLKVYYKNNETAQNINVALLNIVYYYQYFTYKDFQSHIYISSKTDENGFVSFKDIPLFFKYGIFVYKNDSTFYSPAEVGFYANKLNIDDEHFLRLPFNK